MHRGSLRLLLGVTIAAMSLVVAGAAGGAPQKPNAGTVLFGAEQEPPCLNGALAGCNNTWTSWTAGVSLASPYIVKPDFSFGPYMANGAVRVVDRNPFTLLVRIKPRARWSDGRQVTVADLNFTWRTYVNPQNEVASRSGWDSIRRILAVNSKTARIIFAKPYAGWKALMVNSWYPSHALTGANFNEVWNNNYNHPRSGVSMASGPMRLTSYTRGQTLVISRNPTFWGKRPSLDRITFRFITNTDSEIQAIRGGEVDAIYPQPQLQLAQLRGQSGLRDPVEGGTTLEHIDINMGQGNSNPLLAQRWFRQAIIYSMDRRAMVRQLFRTLNPGLSVLQNNMYVSNQKEYQAHFQRYTRQPEPGQRPVPGTQLQQGQRWDLRVCRPAGLGPLRHDRRQPGCVSLRSRSCRPRPGLPASSSGPTASRPVLFFPRIAAKNFDLALYAWVGTGDPSGWIDIYGCGGGSTGRTTATRRSRGACGRVTSRSSESAGEAREPGRTRSWRPTSR